MVAMTVSVVLVTLAMEHIVKVQYGPGARYIPRALFERDLRVRTGGERVRTSFTPRLGSELRYDGILLFTG